MEVVELYFAGRGKDIFSELTDTEEEDGIAFLQDGLFCEYAYIYNKENDTLEIYRGFFKKKQNFLRNIKEIKEGIIDNLEDKKEGEQYYCHLIAVVDRKKHSKEQVLKAFEEYDKEGEESEIEGSYPEHKIIASEIPKNYVPIV